MQAYNRGQHRHQTNQNNNDRNQTNNNKNNYNQNGKRTNENKPNAQYSLNQTNETQARMPLSRRNYSYDPHINAMIHKGAKKLLT